MAIKDENPMLDTKDLAEFLNVKIGTIRKWIKNKRIPPPDLVIGDKKKVPRWKQETIHKFLNEGII